jgi:hypothetical protein
MDHVCSPATNLSSDDLLDHAIRKILLLGIAAHIGEGQHCDRGFVRERQQSGCVNRHRPRRVFHLSETNSVDPHRPSNVFEALFTQIVKCEVEPTRSVFLNTGRNADPARISQTFEPSRHVHAIAEDVAVLHYHVAHINAHPQVNAFLISDSGITLGQCILKFNRTLKGIDDTGELNQQSVPGGFDDPPAMLGDSRVYDFGSDRP